MQNIYLDNAATTMPLELLSSIYEKYSSCGWQNPSALYSSAVSVQKEIDKASSLLINAFGRIGHKCFFTSCGTEGANTVIIRGARNHKNINYVCGGAEHPCVEESFRFLESMGFHVRFIKTDIHGLISPSDVIDAVDENTALVSIMHVNNETGAKNDISAIASGVKAKNPNALFHSDGVQAFLKHSVDASNIDYYTVSAHKLHSHKGTGAVFYKSRSPLKPYILGGGQESGLRSGTQNTLGIISFGAAVDYLAGIMPEINKRVETLRSTLLSSLSNIEGMRVISPQSADTYSPYILSVSFEGVAGETLLHTLENKGIYVSTGSACSSKKGRSRIAKALSLPDSVAAGSIRISFSMHNTIEEIFTTADEICKNVQLLRRYQRT